MKIFFTAILTASSFIFLLTSSSVFAQVTPWNIQRDTTDTNKLKFWYANLATSPLTITTNGKIGLGTANPAQSLHVYGTNPLIQIENTSTGFQGLKLNTPGGWQVGFGTNPAAGLWYDFSNDLGTTHQLYFNGTNWIFPTGKIGLGTASPNLKLDIGSGTGDGIAFGQQSDNTESIQTYIDNHWSDRTTYASGCCNFLLLQPDVGLVGIRTNNPGYTLHVNGNAYFSGGYSGSDIRMKKNIERLTNILPKLDNINGVKFDWKTNEFPEQNLPRERQIGLIAQEVEKQFPELVNKDKQGLKSLDYAKFSAVLLQAVKEQQQEIDQLKKEIQEIQANQ